MVEVEEQDTGTFTPKGESWTKLRESVSTESSCRVPDLVDGWSVYADVHVVHEAEAVVVDDEHKVVSELEVVVQHAFGAIQVDKEDNVVDEVEADEEDNVVHEVEVDGGHKVGVIVVDWVTCIVPSGAAIEEDSAVARDVGVEVGCCEDEEEHPSTGSAQIPCSAPLSSASSRLAIQAGTKGV